MKIRLSCKKVNNPFGNYWIVYNHKGEPLGTFSYDERWKKYAWQQAEDIQMSSDCLRNLADIMDKRRTK